MGGIGKKKAPSKSLRKHTYNQNPVSGIVPMTKAQQQMFDKMNKPTISPPTTPTK